MLPCKWWTTYTTKHASNVQSNSLQTHCDSLKHIKLTPVWGWVAECLGWYIQYCLVFFEGLGYDSQSTATWASIWKPCLQCSLRFLKLASKKQAWRHYLLWISGTLISLHCRQDTGGMPEEVDCLLFLVVVDGLLFKVVYHLFVSCIAKHSLSPGSSISIAWKAWKVFVYFLPLSGYGVWGREDTPFLRPTCSHFSKTSSIVDLLYILIYSELDNCL